jgi:hypothetical protein
MRYECPTHLHPEQLVGKTTVNKPKKKDEEIIVDHNYGGFYSDWLLIDEARKFFTKDESHIEECRSYININCDPYGDNLIQKRSVDQKYEHRLEYFGNATITMFMQPIKVLEEAITCGFTRRFVMVTIDEFTDNEEDIYAERLFGEYKYN